MSQNFDQNNIAESNNVFISLLSEVCKIIQDYQNGKVISWDNNNTKKEYTEEEET